MELENLYLSIINNLSDGVYYVDINRRIQFWNDAAVKLTGYSADEIIGKECPHSNLNHIDAEGHPLCIVGCPLFSTIIDGTQRKANVFVRHKDGHRVPITVNIFPVYDGEIIVGAAEVFSQNSPKVYDDNLIEKLSGIAMHDALTGLPNRRYLESFLDYKLNEYKRFNRPFAVLFADIDNFSKFNNLYGHDVGDAVLRNISASLNKSVRNMDLVGRWGGEEFVGIYTINKDYEVEILGEKFRQLVGNTEVVHDGEALRITVSVGITGALPDDTSQSIIERADHLMYKSKQNGKNQVTVQ